MREGGQEKEMLSFLLLSCRAISMVTLSNSISVTENNCQKSIIGAVKLQIRYIFVPYLDK